jgi:hypothetical protein
MEGGIMPKVELTARVLDRPGPQFTLSEDRLAAAAFLDRYSGGTLEAYRHEQNSEPAANLTFDRLITDRMLSVTATNGRDRWRGRVGLLVLMP